MTTPNPRLGISGRPAGETFTRLQLMDAVDDLARNMHNGPRLGVAGINSWPMINMAATVTGTHPRLGIAGNVISSLDYINDAVGLGRKPKRSENKPAYKVAALAQDKTCWFLDWSYCLGHNRDAKTIHWKPRHELVYDERNRRLPLFFDCGSFRIHSGAKDVEKWMTYENYKHAIKLARPDGYASFDYPGNRFKSMDLLRDLMQTFPQDVGTRMWPIFSCRWVEPSKMLNGALLPGLWSAVAARAGYAGLLPPPPAAASPSQRAANTRYLRHAENWARKAICTGISIARDPDFQYMARTFGCVMLGGMNKGMVSDPTAKDGRRAERDDEVPLARPARHLVALVLRHLYPDLKIWLLGQASYVVANGLGMHEQLQECYMDGCWYINDARADAMAVYDADTKLISTLAVGVGKAANGGPKRQLLGVLREELFAINLRALLSAYCGLLSFPALPRPVDLRQTDQMESLMAQAKQARLEFGEAMGGVA